MSRLKDDDIENLHAQIENGDISEDEKDMGDLNKIDYYPDLQEFINEIDDNNDDGEDNDNTSSTMEEKSLDPSIIQDLRIINHNQIFLVLQFGGDEERNLYEKG
ncbi:unnamed protein product [Euphydryas editha]|uniref:Uncharacterized protein n=1 Tax=Euphydryas editha TaxID=104508 RepID=A0AAU9UWD6_EUPED|nr:unnamed protein product [Euphydryas editha]